MDVKFLLTTFAIWICIHDSYQQSTLSIRPENQAAVLGSDVTFQCQVTQSDALTDYISWEECITTTDGNCARISNDGIIVYSALGGDNNTEARYSIGVVDSKQFNLKISGVTAEDAGQYRCLSRNNAEAHYSAELVVLDSAPECECNDTEDIIYISCQVDYIGTQAPGVEFNIDGSNVPSECIIIDSSVNASIGGHMEYSITCAKENITGEVLNAVTGFTSFPDGDRIASNAPEYEYIEICNITNTKEISTSPTDTDTTITTTGMNSIETSMTTNDPDMSPDSLNITTHKSGTTSQGPDMTSQEPDISTQKADDPDDRSIVLQTWEIIVIGVCGGVVFIFMLVIITVACVKQRKRNKVKKHNETGESKLPGYDGRTTEITLQNQNTKTFSDGYVNPEYQKTVE